MGVFISSIGLSFYWQPGQLLLRDKVSIFWMPYCPYGQTAAHDVLALLDQDSSRNIAFHYIANEHVAESSVPHFPSSSPIPNSSGCEQKATTHPDFGRFSTLHGRRETEESIRQVVIQKRWPDSFRSYLEAFLDDPNGAWQGRAEHAGIPPSDLDSLVHSSTGAKWFSENIRHSRGMGISLSPTLVVSGKPLPKFPSTQEELRVVFCSAGVIKENCQGVLCDSQFPCPDRLGYTSTCERRKCIYRLAPQRADAISAWLIVPDDCVPTDEFPAVFAIGGWAPYFNLTRVSLTDSKAQQLLTGAKISSFPVLVVDGALQEREWGTQCIQDLNLIHHGDRFLVAFDYATSPFASYAQIVQDQFGIHVKSNHYLGALMLHQMGNLEAAAKSYRLALLENPEDYRAWNNLGAILYDHHGLPQSGGKMFQRAANLNPSYEPALRNLLRFAVHPGSSCLNTCEDDF